MNKPSSNDDDTNDTHHCYIETRPTRVPCTLTTIFVMACRQDLSMNCTRLQEKKRVIVVYQQQSPRCLSISTEAWATKA
jgi:hypothetical protein